MPKGNSYRPDAQAFDEVQIVTVPRYKESGLSGDEWRISATVRFLRNGVVKHEFDARNVETALMLAPAEWLRACDDAKGYFASEESFCDQEGCAEIATVFLRRKLEWCGRCGQSRKLVHALLGDANREIRQFCSAHSKRGDCGLDDADSNYEPA